MQTLQTFRIEKWRPQCGKSGPDWVQEAAATVTPMPPHQNSLLYKTQNWRAWRGPWQGRWSPFHVHIVSNSPFYTFSHCDSKCEYVCFYINGKYSPFSVISIGSCEEMAEESGCDSRTLISQYWSSVACSPWEWFNTWWLDAPGSSPSVSMTEGAATRVNEEIRNCVSKSVQGGGGGGDRALYVVLGGLELTL